MPRIAFDKGRIKIQLDATYYLLKPSVRTPIHPACT